MVCPTVATVRVRSFEHMSLCVADDGHSSGKSPPSLLATVLTPLEAFYDKGITFRQRKFGATTVALPGAS